MVRFDKKTMKAFRWVVYVVLVLLTIASAVAHFFGPKDVWEYIMYAWLATSFLQLFLISKIKKMP